MGWHRQWRRWPGVLLGVVLAAMFAASRVDVTPPRVHVRWHPFTTSERRAVLERRYDLRDGRLIDPPTATWQYRLGTRSRRNINALVHDAAVVDTAYIDRAALSVDQPEVRIRWYPLSDLLRGPSQLRQLSASAWLLLAGGLVLLASRAASRRVRQGVTLGVLVFVGVMTVWSPIDPTLAHMGGSEDRLKNRQNFEFFYSGRIRFEEHLSQAILLQLYRHDDSAAAPRHAIATLTRGLTAWYLVSAAAVGVLEGWSPLALRYVGLVLLAPASLLFFGWRELGYVSLNAAAFPLLARGLRSGGMRIEAASAITGLGAALHGAGLVALAGAELAALGSTGPVWLRIRRALTVAAWGTAAYLGWVLLYMLVLKLPISPDPGPVMFSPWRPWMTGELRGGKLFAAAIFSATGGRDLLMTGWMVGAPLLALAVSLRREWPDHVRAALWYAVPSVVFVIVRWPSDGVGRGADLVVAGFPALFALAWVCAHDLKRSVVAAAFLVSAHYAFWRAVLDERFVP